MASEPVPQVFPPPVESSSPHNQTLNAVSFGFIATAVLFAMFLIMAIFERVLRPHRPFQSRNNFRDEEQAEMPTPGPSDSQKPELRHVDSYSRSVSVLMPGHDYPTYFARLIPTPLAPEAVDWPSHTESGEHDSIALQHSSSKKGSFTGIDTMTLREKGATSQTSVATIVKDSRESDAIIVKDSRESDATVVKDIREKRTPSENGDTSSR